MSNYGVDTGNHPGRSGARQTQLDLGTTYQPGQFEPAPNAAEFYQSEGGTAPAQLESYSRQDRFAIAQHYARDKDRVDAGGAPSQELMQSYDALRQAIPEQAARASAVVKTVPGSHDQYPDAQSMTKDIAGGTLGVAPTGPDDSTVAWDATTNDQFRGLHDTIAHGGAGSSFSYDGEALATAAHRSTLPQEAHRALSSEVLGQAAYHEFNGGNFVEQNGLYDVPDWAAKGEPRPTPKASPRRSPGEQQTLF